MQIRVLFFGALKDLTGQASDSLELCGGATVADLLAHYESQFPRLRQYANALAVSVNQEYARRDAPLRDRDEVGLLPPVSGGRSGGEKNDPGGDPGGAPPLSLPPLERQGGDFQGAPLKPAVGLSGNVADGAFVQIIHQRIVPHDLIPPLERPEDGALVIFDGVVRNHSRGRRTLYLVYEAYEEMALKQLHALAREACARFAIRNVALVHRLGRIEIGESSVLIAVFSAHRAAAFDACRWLIDTLKKTVPIWKKEFFADGAVWADGEPFPDEIVRNLAVESESK